MFILKRKRGLNSATSASTFRKAEKEEQVRPKASKRKRGGGGGGGRMGSNEKRKTIEKINENKI